VLIANDDYDIAHFHGYVSCYFIPYIKRSGKKTIFTAHGVESGWDNPKYGFVARSIIKRAFSWGVSRADCVTTVANYLQTELRQRFHINALVTPSGIDREPILAPEIIKENYGLHGNDYLLFLGRIDPIKRVEWLMDLPSILTEGIRVVVAGGPQDSASSRYFEQLKGQCSDKQSLVFTGPVWGREKNELLSNCLAFLAPSKNEGLPVALLEALAIGKCCIASDIAAHKEIIEDGISGFLFDTNNRRAFVDKVNHVLKLPTPETYRVGEKARERVEKVFDWERTSDLLETLYMQVLNPRKQGHLEKPHSSNL